MPAEVWHVQSQGDFLQDVNILIFFPLTIDEYMIECFSITLRRKGMAAFPFTIKPNNSFKDICFLFRKFCINRFWWPSSIQGRNDYTREHSYGSIDLEDNITQSHSEFFMHSVQHSKGFNPLARCLIPDMKNNLNWCLTG